jgi:hypothetical protein
MAERDLLDRSIADLQTIMWMNESYDPTILAMLRNQEFDELENYVSRGRQLAHTPTEELESRWTAQMREWAKNFKNFTGFDHRERHDIQAELAYQSALSRTPCAH